MSRRIAIWAIVILLIAVICSQASAQVVPITDVNPDANILEAYVVADEKDVLIDGTMVHAMVYKDCPLLGVCVSGAGTIPGPQIKAKVGDLVIIHFRNDLDTENASIHWHGIELDNDSDGTAVTQDAVRPGQSYTYQFRMFRPGVYCGRLRRSGIRRCVLRQGGVWTIRGTPNSCVSIVGNNLLRRRTYGMPQAGG